MRVVLDTNVVISRYLSPTGPPAEILRRWEDGWFDLLVSEELLAEYERVFHYPRLRAVHQLTSSEIGRIIANVRQFATRIEVTERLNVVEDDPTDNRCLECARAGGAEVIVCGDEHLLRLREYVGIQIL